MFSEIMDFKTAFTIIHLFGVVIGGGGAFASDFIFFSSVKDRKISSTEMRFLRLGSKMVWIGLFIIVVSGIFIFLTDMDKYLYSSKFLAKMTIVGIIIFNGFVFHISHLPRLRRHVNLHFSSSDEFKKHAPLLVSSGAVSMVSWASAIILGAMRSVYYSYLTIMAGYLILLILAIIISLILKNKILFQK